MPMRRLPRSGGLNCLLTLVLTLVFVLSFAGLLPNTTAFAQAPAAPGLVDAKIEIVWPHGPGTGQLPVSQAPLANLTAYIFDPGTWNPVPDSFGNTVRLWRAINNDPAQVVAIGQKRIQSAAGRNYPVWDFNDIDVSGASNPLTKYTFFLTVDGVQANANIWSHGADARTNLPIPPQPVGASGSAPEIDARIQIVWPHDQTNRQRGVTEATLANVTVALFQAGTLNSVNPDFGGTVRLYRSVNNDPAEAVATGTRRIASQGGINYPVWDFNDIDVSAARDRLNKLYFLVRVDGMNTNSTVWAHGADVRTYFPEVDTPFGTPKGVAAAPAPAEPAPVTTPAVAPPPPAQVASGNLLTNPGFERPYIAIPQHENMRIAEGWTAWWVQGSSQETSQGYLLAPEYKAAFRNDYPYNRVRSGELAQQYFHSWGNFQGGVYQRVRIQAGVRLRFSMWTMIWSCDNEKKGNCQGATSGDPSPTHMRIGIDPDGGTDVFSPHIVWSPEHDSYDAWSELSVEAVSRNSTVTVFAYAYPDYRSQDNNVYLDDASLVILR